MLGLRSSGAKRFFCPSRKANNGEKLLFGQELSLTTEHIGKKDEQYGFS